MFDINKIEKGAFLFILSLSLLFPFDIIAQKEWGIPFLRNYSYREYGAHTQNFTIAQNKDGFMFFGNFEGVLVFDGIRWNKIVTAKNTKVNTLKVLGDYLYVGGENEIGRISSLNPTPFFEPIEFNIDIGAVKDIVEYNNEILFIGEKAILVLRNDSLELLWQIPDSQMQVLGAFVVKDKLYIETGYKLWQFVKGGLKAVPKGAGMPAFMQTVAILKGTEHVHLVTEGYGVFRLQNDSIVRVKEFQNYKLDNEAVSSAILTKQGELILGTQRSGLFRFSEKGKFIENVPKALGLQNNNVNAVFQDKNGKVWAALNNGVSMVDFYLPFRYLNSRVGIRGEIHGITDFKGGKYFFGDQGAYVWEKGRIEPIAEITTACWDVKAFDDNLFFATSKGVLMQTGTKRRYITDRFTFSLLPEKERSLMYLGELDGLGGMVLSNGTWKDGGIIYHSDKGVRNLLKVDNQIWLDLRTDRLIQLDLETKNYTSFSNYDSALPELISYRANMVDNNLLISTKDGLFQYSKTKGFHPYSIFAEDTVASKNVSSIVQNELGSIWFSNWNETSLKHASKKGDYFKVDSNLVFNYLDEFIAWNIVPDSLGRTWFTGPEGIAIYDYYKFDSLPDFKPLIREIRVGEDSVLFRNSLSSDVSWRKFVFSHHLNTIHFNLGVDSYEARGDLMFQYWLDGEATTWSPWTKSSEKEYSNLHYGNYNFKVRVKNVYGQVSEITSFQFTILRPFSQSYWAYALYLVLTGGIIYLVIRWRINALNKEKLYLENIIKERTEEVTASKTEIELKSQLITDKNQELQRINQIVQAINAEIDFTNLLNSILERLKVVKGMDAAVVLQRDTEGRFTVDATWGFAKDKLTGHTISHEAVEKIFIIHSEEFFDELFLNEKISMEDEDLLTMWNFPKSSVTLIITIDSQVEGYLILTNHSTEEAFDERDQSLLRNLKEHLVSAFIKTSLLENVQQSNKQLSETNAIISKQQEDIRGSIQYASKIQAAVMPNIDMLNSNLSDYFVLLRPRDIVSGDFYWLQRTGDSVLYAAADCTGHGVPGAFVSMLAISFLNEIVNRDGVVQPSEILEALREKVKTSLKQNDPRAEQKDGLDIALVSINLKTNELEFAGAYNPLYIIRNNELIELKATKNPIAVYLKEKSFENHNVQLQEGDVLYSFSDGYADQFGGEKSKKLYVKRFKEILMEIHLKPMDEQKEILLDRFDKWRGDIEQIDDVLVFGVRIH